MQGEAIKVNKNWREFEKPFMTVMTPVYNRRATIKRAIDSVEKQTFRNIEYIIIDDGSTEEIDDIVYDFMESTKIPVMFVKKNNGGVHTARNMGYKYARGELILCVDSDDELKPKACEVFHDTWFLIPKAERKKYWQMKAQDIDQNGRIVGSLFPKNINELSKEEARKYFSLAKGDQIGCRVVSVMKKNMFPEPKGITFVSESVRWAPLELKYRSWGINDALLICHRDGDDHLYNRLSKKLTKQGLRNEIWNITYKVNRPVVFLLTFKKRLKYIFGYCVFFHLLMFNGDKKFAKKNRLIGRYNNFWKMFFYIPSAIFAFYYNKNVMKTK